MFFIRHGGNLLEDYYEHIMNILPGICADISAEGKLNNY